MSTLPYFKDVLLSASGAALAVIIDDDTFMSCTKTGGISVCRNRLLVLCHTRQAKPLFGMTATILLLSRNFFNRVRFCSRCHIRRRFVLAMAKTCFVRHGSFDSYHPSDPASYSAASHICTLDGVYIQCSVSRVD